MSGVPNSVMICANCEDYNDRPRIKKHGAGWRHVTNNSVRCPGQEDDDTDDRVIPEAISVREAKDRGII